MKLLNANVLIEKIETVGSRYIHVPQGFNLEVEQKAKVIDVGPGRLGRKGQRIPCDVKAGDTVFYYELAEVHRAPDNQFVINEDKIFFVLNPAHGEA